MYRPSKQSQGCKTQSTNWATTIQSEEQYDEMIATAEAAIRKVEGR